MLLSVHLLLRMHQAHGFSLFTQDVQLKEKHYLYSFICLKLRPPLSKKSFPVGRVGKKNSWKVGIFFFSNFFFFKLECTGGEVKKKLFEKMKKKVLSAVLDPPGRYTGNYFLFKGGLILQNCNILNSGPKDDMLCCLKGNFFSLS